MTFNEIMVRPDSKFLQENDFDLINYTTEHLDAMRLDKTQKIKGHKEYSMKEEI